MAELLRLDSGSIPSAEQLKIPALQSLNLLSDLWVANPHVGLAEVRMASLPAGQLPAERSVTDKNVNMLALENLRADQLKNQTKAEAADISFGRKATGVVAGVASTFLTNWAVSQGLKAGSEYLPLPPLARAAIGLGTALLVGGVVNNKVTGRDLLASTGYVNNAGFSAATYVGYKMISAAISDGKNEMAQAAEKNLFAPVSTDTEVPLAKQWQSSNLNMLPVRKFAYEITTIDGATVEFDPAAKTAGLLANGEKNVVLKIPAAMGAEGYAEAHTAAAYTQMMFSDPEMKAAAEAAAGNTAKLVKAAGALEIKPSIFGVSLDVKKTLLGLSETSASTDPAQAAFRGAQAYVKGETSLFNEYSQALASRFGPFTDESRSMAIHILQDPQTWNRNYMPALDGLMSTGIPITPSSAARKSAIFKALEYASDQAAKLYSVAKPVPFFQ